MNSVWCCECVSKCELADDFRVFVRITHFPSSENVIWNNSVCKCAQYLKNLPIFILVMFYPQINGSVSIHLLSMRRKICHLTSNSTQFVCDGDDALPGKLSASWQLIGKLNFVLVETWKCIETKWKSENPLDRYFFVDCAHTFWH